MTPIKRAAIVLVLVFCITLAGCSSGILSGGNSGVEDLSHSNSDPGETGAERPSQSIADGVNAQTQQALIRTGTVHIKVEDFDAARTNLTRAVREQGGFVSDSVKYGSDSTSGTSGRIVYRVPAKNFSAFFEHTKKEGEVLRSKTNTTDVTDRVVDLEARLKNLRAQRDRLRKLYDQANDTKSVLSVGKRLSTVQGKIERLKAQRRTLENQITYSTVIVELSEPTPTDDTQKHWYETGVIDAFIESVGGVIVALRALLVGGAYVLPYLIVFGLPLLGLGVVLRRRF